MERLLEELRKKYTNTKFYELDDGDMRTILFDNEVLEDDEEFYNFVFALVERYLTKEDMLNFAIVYDYLNEIDKECTGEELKIVNNFCIEIDYDLDKKVNDNFIGGRKRFNSSDDIFQLKFMSDDKFQKSSSILLSRFCLAQIKKFDISSGLSIELDNKRENKANKIFNGITNLFKFKFNDNRNILNECERAIY